MTEGNIFNNNSKATIPVIIVVGLFNGRLRFRCVLNFIHSIEIQNNRSHIQFFKKTMSTMKKQFIGECSKLRVVELTAYLRFHLHRQI